MLFKKIGFILLFFSLAVLLFSRCKTDQIYFLTDEDLTWMRYEANDSIIFNTASGLKRIYKISGRWRGNDIDNMAIYLLNDSSARPQTRTVLIKRTAAGLSVEISWPYFPATMNPLLLSPGREIVNGITYNDVYASKVTSTDDVKEIWYSKSKGFIRFIQSNGTVWNIAN